MRRLILGAFFLVACAEPDNVPPGDHHIGGGNDDAGGADGGSDGGMLVCYAEIEMLSGTAVYVQGTIAAARPSDRATDTENCDEWMFRNAAALEASVKTPVAVGAGLVNGVQATMIGYRQAGADCAYTLRIGGQPVPPAILCAYTLNYLLTTPL